MPSWSAGLGVPRVAVTPVQHGASACNQTTWIQFRTLMNPSGHPDEQLEGVLGATPDAMRFWSQF